MKTLIRIICLVLMIVSFIAYIARASAFPIASANLLPWSLWFFLFAFANILLWQRVMKLLSFSLLVIWFYAFTASIVPETSTAKLDLSSIERTPDAFVEAGEAIFKGKGKCLTCHTLDPSAPKGRCPDLTGIGTRAATRKPGMTAKEYFIESAYEPEKFLVPGYGKIMPPVWKAPISLSNLEIETVIAFLQSQGGEVDLTPFEPPVDTGSAAVGVEVLPPILTGDPDRGKNVFVNGAKCVACHNVAGLEKPIDQTLDEGVEVVAAPELTDIAALNSLRYIEESILKPNAEIVSGYGSASVRVGGAAVQGTLVSQDSEQMVLRIKAPDGSETERTILFSELEPEPIEELVNLKEKGYFWVQATPADATAPISGELVEEDEESITLKVGDETQTISKSDVKVQVTVTTFDDDEPIVGELVSETDDEVILNVDGAERTIDQFDVDTMESSRAFGKRLAVTSPMPSNFPQLLSVADMNDLLAFLTTLTGEAAGETAAAAEGAEAAEPVPAE
ncbi:MAG: c-type cytochrome [Candidatus Poribacteria bacterium]|nr:c-type cytochrome [Candidatus Poribacteria bacterium]